MYITLLPYWIVSMQRVILLTGNYAVNAVLIVNLVQLLLIIYLQPEASAPDSTASIYPIAAQDSKNIRYCQTDFYKHEETANNQQ